MPEIQIKIKNLPQIKRAFGLAPALMSGNLNIAIRKTVLTIGGQSRRRTPVRTGRLRASHYERFSNLKGEVGTNTSYDRYVHWGTRYMKARPYLQEAVEASEPYLNRFFRDAVQNTLNSIGKRT